MKPIPFAFAVILTLASVVVYGHWSCDQLGDVASIDAEWHRVKRGWCEVLHKERILLGLNDGVDPCGRLEKMRLEHNVLSGYFQALDGELTHIRQRLQKLDQLLSDELRNRGMTNNEGSVALNGLATCDYSNPQHYKGDAPIVLPMDWNYVTLRNNLSACTNICNFPVYPFGRSNYVVRIEHKGDKYCVMSRLSEHNEGKVIYECSTNQLSAIKISLATSENVITGISLREYDRWSWFQMYKNGLGTNECNVVFNGTNLLFYR